MSPIRNYDLDQLRVRSRLRVRSHLLWTRSSDARIRRACNHHIILLHIKFASFLHWTERNRGNLCQFVWEVYEIRSVSENISISSCITPKLNIFAISEPQVYWWKATRFRSNTHRWNLSVVLTSTWFYSHTLSMEQLLFSSPQTER